MTAATLSCACREKWELWDQPVSSEKLLLRWRLKARETRMLAYLFVVLAVAGWKYIPRPWHPTLTMESLHYKVFSTAREEQTRKTADALESLYLAYSNRLGSVNGFQRTHGKLQIKLYRERAEMRRVNPGLDWAEAFYRKPFCHAYFSAEEINPYHWMLHECVHQLNQEVAHLELVKWLEEGLSEYFSTSRLIGGELNVGRIDLNTYPVWWIEDIATGADLGENIRNGSVIPLRAIITNRGGPSMNRQFNLYYLHWWSLTHFIWESEKYRDRALALVQKGGGLAAFEEVIGPAEQIQTEWHNYVRRLKSAAAGKDREFFKTGKVSGLADVRNTPETRKIFSAPQPTAGNTFTNPSAGSP